MPASQQSGPSGDGKLYKVTFDLKKERADWPPVSAERLWAEKTGVKLELRLVNTPYFARGVSLGDQVLVRPDHDRREFIYDKLTTESGHSTVRVVLMDAESRSEVESKIHEFGCSWEGADQFPALFAVDIPPSVDYQWLREWLKTQTSDGVVEFQESAISALHRAQFPREGLRGMLMRYAKIEEVDDVLTLIFAEGPGEEGFILNVMRPVPGSMSGAFDSERETYTLVTGDQDCVTEGGVREWSIQDHVLTLSLTDEAAGDLGIDRTQSFELAVSDEEVDSIRDALKIAFSPVGFPGLSRLSTPLPGSQLLVALQPGTRSASAWSWTWRGSVRMTRMQSCICKEISVMAV